MVTDEQFVKATQAAAEREAHTPKAVSANFDRRLWRIVVHLSTGIGLFFDPRDAEGLENATPLQLNDIEVTPSGYGLHFPQLDADLYVPAILKGILGSERWIASRVKPTGKKAKSLAPTKHGSKAILRQQQAIIARRVTA